MRYVRLAVINLNCHDVMVSETQIGQSGHRGHVHAGLFPKFASSQHFMNSCGINTVSLKISAPSF